MNFVRDSELHARGSSAVANMEYWAFMPRLSVLVAFFKDAPAPLLHGMARQHTQSSRQRRRPRQRAARINGPEAPR